MSRNMGENNGATAQLHVDALQAPFALSSDCC